MRSRSGPSVRRMPAARHERAASSHWLRLKMNTIAGSSCALVEQVDRLDASRRVEHAPTAPPRRPLVSRLAAAAPHGRGVEPGGLGVGPPADERLQQVDAVVGAVADEVAVVEVDGPAQLDDGRRRAAHRLDPRRQLGRVADRRRQAHQLHVAREVDDHLLPHRPAVGVLQEVDLVEHDEAEVVERAGSGVDHVAQHLGRHHDDRCVAVDGVVARQQPDVAGAVARRQVAVLLVRQRLQRGGVERAAAGLPRGLDAVLGDDRLAAPGRRGDDDVVAGVEGVDRLELEVVEGERVAADDRRAPSTPWQPRGQSLRRRRRGGGCAAGRASR